MSQNQEQIAQEQQEPLADEQACEQGKCEQGVRQDESEQPEQKRSITRFLPLLVLVVVAAAVIIKKDDLGNFVKTIQEVSLIPFICACVCLFGRYLGHAYAYKELFRCVDEEVPYFHIIPLVFSVTFANDMAPTGGTAGSVLIAAWSHKQGLDMGKSVTIVFLEKIGFFGGFAVVMLIGFIILIATGQMTLYLVIGGLAVFMFVVVFGFVLILGYKHPATERRLFAWTERRVNDLRKLFKKDPMNPWSEQMTGSFHEAACIAAQKPKVLLISLARMVLLHAFDCACFICVGFAFNFTYIPFLVAGYVAGFIIATFIPQTIGAVEVLLALILGGYGASAGQAAAIAIAYRGLIFWVPFLIGAICINITGSKRSLNSGEAQEVLVAGSEENAESIEDIPPEPEGVPIPPHRFEKASSAVQRRASKWVKKQARQARKESEAAAAAQARAAAQVHAAIEQGAAEAAAGAAAVQVKGAEVAANVAGERHAAVGAPCTAADTSVEQGVRHTEAESDCGVRHPNEGESEQGVRQENQIKIDAENAVENFNGNKKENKTEKKE